MATRSTISIRYADGYFVGIYCHNDGYPSHQAPILLKHYSTLDKVEALIALGAISVLDASTECPRDHNFSNPVQGYCIAYHRDRGDEFFQILSKTIDGLRKKSEEYNYVFDEGQWYYFRDRREEKLLLTLNSED